MTYARYILDGMSGLGVLGSSYSIPSSQPFAIARATGAIDYAVTFQNPDGTYSSWYSNWGAGPIPGDTHFVNPPASVWGQLGIFAQATIDNIKAQEAASAAAVVAAAQQAATSHVTQSGSTSSNNSQTTTNTTNNTTSGGASSGIGVPLPGQGIMTDFINGITSLFEPGQWGLVIGSGNVGEIAGLAALPLAALFMFHHARGRR